MSKTYVIGDIHGNHKALIQCLKRSGFNKKEDTLIQLGDIVDGYSEVYECVEELLSIKNLIAIRGNHDDWFRSFLNEEDHPVNWLQGGLATLQSYCKYTNNSYTVISNGFKTDLNVKEISINHINFFNNQFPYYIDSNNRLFVHGGFNRHFFIEDALYNTESILMWDRDLWMAALSYKEIENKIIGNKGRFKTENNFEEIFIGHTTTMNWNTDKPMKGANIWNLDTGAGYKGKLTIMNVETKEYFQSDSGVELYPNEKGR